MEQKQIEQTGLAQKPKSLQRFMKDPLVQGKIMSCLGTEKKTAAFVSTVISIATSNNQLRNCRPETILGAAMVAASLDLPLVPTLGMAYIVPYKGSCQFQIGYKGLIELAQRSGVFRSIIDEPVYEGELVKGNRFYGEYEFDESKRVSDKVIGYMASFSLTNGFSKLIYWNKSEIEAHAKKFSQSYRSEYTSPWKTDFDAMARKTVLKALFSKYAPKSISYELQTAINFDQSVCAPKYTDNMSDETLNIDNFDVTYPDNDNEGVAVEVVKEEIAERKQEMKSKATKAPKML